MLFYRTLAWLLAVPPILGCTPEPTATTVTSTPTPTPTSTSTSTSTGGPTGRAPVDGATCDTRAAKINRYLETNRTCTKVEDCVIVTTPCGTNGVCGAYVTRGAEDGLQKLAGELGSCPPAQPCPNCSPPLPAACVGGICTVR
jgi:hypothetical protein